MNKRLDQDPARSPNGTSQYTLVFTNTEDDPRSQPCQRPSAYASQLTNEQSVTVSTAPLLLEVSDELVSESEPATLRCRSTRAPIAFKDLMIHLILQFTLRIAFRCVLHRCRNQEIHRSEAWILVRTRYTRHQSAYLYRLQWYC